MDRGLTQENEYWNGIGHLWRIELGEAKGCLAELAMLFLRMGQPFDQAILVNELDATTAFARVEQRLFLGTLATTYPAGVLVFHALLLAIEGRIIHNVRLANWLVRWARERSRTLHLVEDV